MAKFSLCTKRQYGGMEVWCHLLNSAVSHQLQTPGSVLLIPNENEDCAHVWYLSSPDNSLVTIQTTLSRLYTENQYGGHFNYLLLNKFFINKILTWK